MSWRSLASRQVIAMCLLLTLTALGTSTSHAAAGLTSSCAQPPTNVDLTTLPDSQLALYGLRKRPTNAEELARWSKQLHYAKHRICATTPTNRDFSQENSANWAGYVGTGGSYDYVYAEWNVPSLGASVRGSDSGTWIGLGGDPNDDPNQGTLYLPQAGTEQGLDYTGTTYYDAWIQDYNYNHEQVLGTDSNGNQFTISAGDTMSVYVSSNYDFANQVYYDVSDVTTGQYFAQNYTWDLSDGSTGEWIEERPGQYLANFRSVTFTSCEAVRYSNSNPIYLGNLPYNSMYMWTSVGSSGQGQGNELAYPGSISNSTNFTVTWYHAS